MKFDHEKIRSELRDFWRENKKKVHYFLNGKEVSPEKVSNCDFQLNEVEHLDGYNFEVTTLGLRVQIKSLEMPYVANFVIKVEPVSTSDSELPEEKIIGIYDNRVTLHKY